MEKKINGKGSGWKKGHGSKKEWFEKEMDGEWKCMGKVMN